MPFGSFLKTILNSHYTVWLVLALPAPALLADIARHERYYAEIMYESGLLSVQLMVLALAITPLLHILRWSNSAVVVLRWMQKRRRAIGVAAFGYALLHTFFYIRETGAFDLILLEMADIALTTGWLAFVIMTVLAVTSNNFSVRKLGRRWKLIQRTIYICAALTALHWLLIDQFLRELPIWSLPLIVLQTFRLLLLGLKTATSHSR